MKAIAKKIGLMLLTVALVAATVVFARLGLATVQVARVAEPEALAGVATMGSTRSLTILPLYEEAAVDASFESGHGVSYLIRTDTATILMDLGHNPAQEARAPLVRNMAQAGITADEIDMLVISHPHPDHTGGLNRQPVSFEPEQGRSVLEVAPAYVPEAVELGGQPVQVTTAPRVLAPGVATLGRMAFVQPFPFWLWQPLAYEQVLAVNVEGQGLVLITGCGHPTLEKIVARAERLFAEPVVGIAGGLHYEGLAADEIAPHVAFLAARDPQLVALSPHDDGPEAIAAFQKAFPAAYRAIRVGEAIQFGAPAVAGMN